MMRPMMVAPAIKAIPNSREIEKWVIYLLGDRAWGMVEFPGAFVRGALRKLF